MTEKIEYPEIGEKRFWEDLEDVCRKTGHTVLAEDIREKNLVKVLTFIVSLMERKK